ncbi:hypothetical protein COY17_02745 [Candidatus Saccharibacteria bacterium CG_4_10_14_0_2_um_filter_52_9]|nr:MAG: hypothetical protein COY17_02745 [Candidatus Saccharibacteria bacterium CG_4_10_14_0_2_um_filter_52_9]
MPADPANLTDIMAPHRLIDRKSITEEDRIGLIRVADHLEHQNRTLIGEVAREGRLPGDEVPSRDRDEVLELAQGFTVVSIGHTAVEAMAGQLQRHLAETA